MKRISATGGVLSKKKFLKKPATLLKKALAQGFSYDFYEIYQSSSFVEQQEWSLTLTITFLQTVVLKSCYKISQA